MTGDALDRWPVIVAIAGPNGAGKTTFFYSYDNGNLAVPYRKVAEFHQGKIIDLADSTPPWMASVM